MKLAKLFLLPLLVPGASMACLNSGDGGTTIDGRSGKLRIHAAAALERAKSESSDEKFRHIQSATYHHADESPVKEELEGIQHVLDGEYRDALEIFQRIEAEHPGLYNTASNLGTTYELLGELDPAMRWIAEGMRRNEHSHAGTEWLHLAILKAKSKLEEDPGFLSREPLISVPNPLTRDSMIVVDGKEYPAVHVHRALEYQLHERVFFVRSQDPVVAELLFSFGQIEASLQTLESAVGLLEMARDYGYPDSARLDEVIGGYRSMIWMSKLKKAALIASGIAVFVLLLFFAYKKKWFFLSSRDYKKHLEMKKLQQGISPSGAA